MAAGASRRRSALRSRRGLGHVQEIQRARLLAGAGEACARLGASEVTVADVVAHAGVSRRTFYELFANREECLLAAFEDALERAASFVVPAYEEPQLWQDRVRAALVAFVSLVESRPATGRMLIVDSLAAGQAVAERRLEVLQRLAKALDDGGRGAARACDPPALAGQAALGAVLAILHARLLRRKRVALAPLVPDLMGALVLAYLGPAAARAELGRAVAPQRPTHRASQEPLTGLPVRLTYRTMQTLLAIGAQPGGSNREIGQAAGIEDQGQISKLLARLERAGLIVNAKRDRESGERNAWTLTPAGARVHDAIASRLPGV